MNDDLSKMQSEPMSGWKIGPTRPTIGIKNPQTNMDEYMTEVTRDMKRMMDEHTVLLKELVAVLVSIRNSQQQDRWNDQRRGK